MLETPVRRLSSFCLTFALPAAFAVLFSSCATDQPRTVLIDDPDAQKESSIPWNKPAKWETGANVPGGLGGGPGDPGSDN